MEQQERMCCSVLQRHLNGFHSGPGQSVDRGRIVEPRGALVLPGIDHPKTASRREKSQPARIALYCFLVTGNQAASSKRHTESIQLNLPRSIAEWGGRESGIWRRRAPISLPLPARELQLSSIIPKSTSTFRAESPHFFPPTVTSDNCCPK